MSHNFPEVSPRDLRDNATTLRVARVWRRLRVELGSVEQRPRGALWWVPATFVIVFGSGVFVGAHWAEPARAVVVEAEPFVESAAPASQPLATPRNREPQRAPHPAKRRRAASRAEPEQTMMSVPVEAVAPAVVVEPVAEEPPEWQRLANLGEYASALEAVEAAGGFDALLNAAAAEQLLTLVDIARATGQRGRAIQALRLVTARHQSDPNAPIAAMMLGNMLLQEGDRAGAAAAFELNRRLSPKGDFAEDALARQLEVALDQGNLVEAQRLAEQYEADFPQGRRLEEVRGQLARALTAAEALVEPAGEPSASAVESVSEEEAELPPSDHP
jgi:hypothetical protein